MRQVLLRLLQMALRLPNWDIKPIRSFKCGIRAELVDTAVSDTASPDVAGVGINLIRRHVVAPDDQATTRRLEMVFKENPAKALGLSVVPENRI